MAWEKITAMFPHFPSLHILLSHITHNWWMLWSFRCDYKLWHALHLRLHLQCSWHSFVYFILLWGWFIFFRALFLRKSFFRVQFSRIAASKSYEHWMHCILCMQMCICVSQLFFKVFVFTQMNSLDLPTLRTWYLNSQALVGLLSSKVMSEWTKKILWKSIFTQTHTHIERVTMVN